MITIRDIFVCPDVAFHRLQGWLLAGGGAFSDVLEKKFFEEMAR